MQAFPSKLVSLEEYFWWMPWFTAVFPELVLASNLSATEVTSRPPNVFAHTGIHYTRWLKEAAQALEAKLYFEIGNNGGESIRAIQCDAVCVHPFLESTNVLMRRRNTHFYQGTSDEFFSDLTAVNRVVPEGIDLAFLDGLHLVEVLLRDFINAEQLANTRSMFVLHDCLPLNERMAQRKRYSGDDSEPKEIGGFWTGDVWKIVPLLAKYRPELHISYVDCPPTGLVVCTGLDRENRVLVENYDRIVGESEALTLTSFGLDKLWDLFPMLKSDQVFKTQSLFDKAFFGEKHGPVAHSNWRNLMRS
ncbi:methyltransferase type 11 [Mesorhizobium sp. LNHC221B00]|nr:methyltransferase type 11 [Mesorhizobium sp. LNHC221B00]